MESIRPLVVKGKFYPQNPAEIEEFIESILAKTPQAKKPVKAVILPHAGYIYSGETAIKTLATVVPKKEILLLGPNHTGKGSIFSLCDYDFWQGAFGKVKTNSTLKSEILKQCSLVRNDNRAHQQEHSLEVQIPLLEYIFGKKQNTPFLITPLVVGAAGFSALKELALCLRKALDNCSQEDILIVASSDFNHYLPEKECERLDKYAIESILDMDAEGFFKKVEENNLSVCGAHPITMALLLAKMQGAQKAELVEHTTSARASGDKSTVVGYAGIIIY